MTLAARSLRKDLSPCPSKGALVRPARAWSERARLRNSAPSLLQLGMNSELILQSIQERLGEIGYSSNLIRREYLYADVSGLDYAPRRISLAAFAQDPPSYRNACIGELNQC